MTFEERWGNKMSDEIDRKPIIDDNGNIVGWLRTKDKTFEEIEKELKELKELK